LSDNVDAGFLTHDIISLMVAFAVQKASSSMPLSVFELLKKFFIIFSSEFEYNESSVASAVSRCPIGEDGTIFGSAINEEEGIDSDVDDDFRWKRISRKNKTDDVVGDDGSSPVDHQTSAITTSLSGHANDNDEVHPHKRQRFELGLIRDIRRFYEVENKRKIWRSCILEFS
jgi:hypothetical protein